MSSPVQIGEYLSAQKAPQVDPLFGYMSSCHIPYPKRRDPQLQRSLSIPASLLFELEIVRDFIPILI
jgi:hypothetical protein